MAKKQKKYGATPVQDYSSFKTPKDTKWANIRQNRILDKYKTSTGALANQADDLRNAGYTLNDTMDAVYSPSGGQVAGINKYGSWGGNKEVADIIKRNLPQNASPIVGDRVANTFNVLDQIYGLDEMSKAGENKINKAFDSGRGLQFAPNPADPFRVMSNSPTFSEFLGGFGRMLGGGTAKQTVPGLSIANQPRKQEGILGLLFNKMPTLKMIKEAFGKGEEEEQLNALQMQRQGYANDPYSVPVGPALPLDYLQGGYNRLGETGKAYDDLVNQTDSSYQETSDELNKTVEDMSDVEKEIFLNRKLKYARNDSAIRLALEQENDAKELKKTRDKIKAEGEAIKQQFNNRLKEIMESTYPTMREPRGDGILSVYDNFSNLAKGMLGAENYKTTTEETLDTLDTPEIFRDQFTGTGQSYMDTEDNFNSRIPPGTANIPGGTPTGTANAPGGSGNFLDSDAYREMLLDNYRKKEMGTGNMPGGVDDMGLPVQGDITIDVNKDIPYFGTRLTETPLGEFDSEKNIKNLRDNQSGIKTLSEGNSITDYLNPGNLVDVGQDGTTGKTYGENEFAIFDSVDSGLIALTKDVKKKVGDFNGNVKKIISKYASGDPDVKGYVDFITDIVGPTVEKNEIPTLIESIIIKENKPEIADQYLDYLKENSDKIYDGIISSKNNTSKNNTMLAEITQADIDRFKQPMTQTMDYDTYKSINTDSTLTPEEFNQLKARVA